MAKSAAKKTPAKKAAPAKKPAAKKPAAKLVKKAAPAKKQAAAKAAPAKKLIAKKPAPAAVKKPAAKPVAAKKPAPKPVASKPATPTVKKPVTKSATASKPAVAAKPAPVLKPKKPYKPVKLPAGYKPTEKEEYMNPQQQEYFRQKLLNWRKELMNESRETLDHLHEENWHQADIADRASLETEAGVELRTRNRYLKLISKIDSAVRRIEEGEYGYCEDTGDEIGLKRLEARPVVTRTTEAQERYERAEKQYSDED